ncbi:MAG: esterase-like activity of phytase family protein [Pseudomonadota bacterium]
MHDRSLGRLVVAICLACLAATSAHGARLEYVGGYVWDVPDPSIGGLSGIEVTADGGQFWAVGDKGVFVEGRFLRENGRITGIDAGARPLGSEQEPGRAPIEFTDAEGLALTPDGTLFISFEGFHRVWPWDDAAGMVRRFPNPQEFAGLQRNSSLETLAADAAGNLYTLPERSGKLTRPFPVYRISRDGSRFDIAFQIPRRGEFLPAGADFGPDGRFYLVERHFLGILGFRTRIRVFTLEGDEIVAEETLLETEGPVHGNLEGISVWEDDDGFLRLTLVADDNFRSFLSTEFVEYRLIP